MKKQIVTDEEESKFEEFYLYNGKCKVKFYPKSHRYTVNGNKTGGSVTSIISIKDKSGGLTPWAVNLAVKFLKNLYDQGVSLLDEHFRSAKMQHLIKKMEAADVGSQVHDWVEGYIKYTLKEKGYENVPPMPEMKEAQIGVNAFLDWVSENKVKFISSERAIYSLKHDYIGKMDIEAKVNGKLCLLDIKTSNDLRNEYYMQTAAYVHADEEESGKKYHGRWLIRLAKETEKQYKARMDEKNADRALDGKDPFDFPPYEVFEPMYLDEEPTNMNRDFKAFLACKVLSDFEKETGFKANKKK